MSSGLGDRFRELAEHHAVPGAVLGVLRVGAAADGSEDLREVVAHGTLNSRTGVETTADSVFQIGSVTKIWTATLASQLVDRGDLDLDTPVADVLPELTARPEVTTRHLLTHSSGIDGDLIVDTGRGDDALATLAARSTEQEQLFEPGTAFSYCNVGFGIVGRLIEVITGRTWDVVLRKQLLEPLGLAHTGTLPEQALLHRAAVGHVRAEGRDVRPVSTWMFPRSMGPAGLIHSTADDVLTFARMHLRDGVHTDGTRVLRPETARAMRHREIEVPPALAPTVGRGLGWRLDVEDGRSMYGHHGSVIGQFAALEILDDADAAIVLLTNGPGTAALWHDLRAELLADLGGITASDPVPGPPPEDQDAADFVGRYSRCSETVDVHLDGGRLRARLGIDWDLEIDEIGEDEAFDLQPTREPGVFLYRAADTAPWSVLWFGRLPAGRPYVFIGDRITPLSVA